jgi:hypothetical protein
MNKKGQGLPINKLILGIVAVIVLILVLVGAGGQFGKFTNFFKFLPTFEQDTELVGDAIIGYNLEYNELYHYDGRSWKLAKEGNLILGDHEINVVEAEENFEAFFMGERKTPYKFRTGNFRLSEVVLHKKPMHQFINKLEKPYVGTVYEETIQIPYNDEPKFIKKVGDGMGKFDSNYYAKSNKKIIEWRDQILAGEDYEKFVKFAGKSYTVRKMNPYLVVDLNDEKFGEDKYSSMPEIKFDDRSDWVNDWEVVVRCENYWNLHWKKQLSGQYAWNYDNLRIRSNFNQDNLNEEIGSKGFDSTSFYDYLFYVWSKNSASCEGTILSAKLIKEGQEEKVELVTEENSYSYYLSKSIENIMLVYNSKFRPPTFDDFPLLPDDQVEPQI